MEAADLSHHTSRRFNEDLERVRTKVLGMGGFVEQQLSRCLTALVDGDSALGQAVALDDYKVNSMEVSIDEECQKILATRAPAAGDLRVIVATIKAITDLERIGDEGEKIGYIASRLASMERPPDKYREIKHLGRIVSEMVHQALDSFARMDAEGFGNCSNQLECEAVCPAEIPTSVISRLNREYLIAAAQATVA